MAQVTSKSLTRNHAEVMYGTLFSGSFTNTTYELVLEPGIWRVALFVNASGVSAGTLTCTVTLPDGTSSEIDAIEQIFWLSGTTLGSTLALTDFIGVAHLNSGGNGGTNVETGVACLATAVYSSLKFTIASIAGASATNRIDYVAQRVR